MNLRHNFNLVLISLILWNSNSFSQHEYFPADDGVWNGTGQTSVFLACHHFYVDTVQIDTVIGIESYKILRFSELSGGYFCAFRSDTVENAIYIIAKDSVNEHLFFDFDESYQVGDSVEVNLFRRPVDADFVKVKEEITEIDSILVGGSHYKTYKFWSNQGNQNSFVPFAITEHYLNLDGMPFCAPEFFETTSNLKCYKEFGSDVVEVSSDCPWEKTDCVDWYNISSGLEKQNVKVDVYPNPSDGIFNISIVGSDVNEIYINDVLGREVLRMESFSGTNTVDLSHLQGATYYIQIKTEHGLINRIIVLQ